MDSKILIGIGAIAVLGVGAYAISRGAPSTPVSSGSNAVALAVTPAPDFSLERLGGGTIALADYKGKEPVILDFWTTWCPNCKRDMPHQNEWYLKYKDRVEVIGIDMREDPTIVAATIRERGIAYPIALDQSGATATSYGINYTNVHVLIDKNGNIVKTIPGDISEQEFLSLIN